jgi:hypothetical protein
VEQIPLTTWDPANPRYFSGTGCEAKAIAVPWTGYLSHVQICINDQVVQEYWDNAAPSKPSALPTDGSVITGTNLTSATIKALFDSTHFADVSPITIKLKVTDSNSGYYEVTVVGPVKNRLYGIANQNLKFGKLATGTFAANQTLDDVVSTAQQMNYTAVESITDDKIAVLNTLPSYTAFFAFTHGEIGVGSCTATRDDASQFLRSTDILNQIAVKAVNLNLPPYNFVELDACSLGGTDDYIGAFGITRNLSGLPIHAVDRAGIAWAPVIVADWNNEGWSEKLWEELNNGRTLYDATLLAEMTWTVFAESKEFPSLSSPFPFTLANVSIYGDPKTTLHGVYGGFAPFVTSSSLWYRPL